MMSFLGTHPGEVDSHEWAKPEPLEALRPTITRQIGQDIAR
jgi:hypothetical protein